MSVAFPVRNETCALTILLRFVWLAPCVMGAQQNTSWTATRGPCIERLTRALHGQGATAGQDGARVESRELADLDVGEPQRPNVLATVVYKRARSMVR